MPTSHDRSTVVPPTPQEEAYVLAVLGEAHRLLRSGRLLHADDIAQEIAGHTLAAAPRLMAQHPDPVLYARTRVRHASISYDRTQRAQRGEGVRLVVDADGTVHPGRRGVSGDAPAAESGEPLFGSFADPDASFEQALVGALDAHVALQRLVHGEQPVTAMQLAELLEVDGLGHRVQDVAARRSQARETVSRRISRTRTTLRQNRAALLAVLSS
ncbi:MAG: hypothetical protein ACOYMR_09860 [Ilumatobacteraceae bacterium]